MARKKTRSPHAASGPDSGGVATAITAKPAKQPAHAAPAKRPSSDGSFNETPTGRFLIKLFRAFSSLKMAMPLLSLFTLCLIIATLFESWYSTKIAQDLIYKTKWFALLLVLLAINILCAALKKYPWKKYQTGFLITHTGLLILNFGGLLTALGGTEGLMTMVDSERPDVNRYYGISNRSSTLLFPDEQKIEVWRGRSTAIANEADADLVARLIAKNFVLGDDFGFREHDREGFMRLVTIGLKKKKGVDFDVKNVAGLKDLLGNLDELREILRAAALEDDGQQIAFNPGPFTWYADEKFTPQVPVGVRFFHTLANPWPSFAERLDNRTTFTVKNFYSHTEHVPYSESTEAKRNFPVLKVGFRSPNFGKTPEKWVAARINGQSQLGDVALTECLIMRDKELLPEFLNPPAAVAMGKQGQLVFLLGGKTVRVQVNKDQLGATQSLEGGYKVTIKSYKSNIVDPHSEVPAWPAVEFELTGPQGKSSYQVIARLPHVIHAQGDDAARVSVWYHHPDFRWGNKDLRGTLQFLQTPDGLYYRVYGKEGFQDSGQIDLSKLDDPDQWYVAWRAMDLRFRVSEYLPHGIAEPRIVPRNVRPGVDRTERPDLSPAIRCSLSHGSQSHDFWLRMEDVTPEAVQVGNHWYFLRYGMGSKQMSFELTLLKAQRVTDPGTERAASFSSDVILTYWKNGKKYESQHHICMNEPLEHDGYKMYQSGFEFLTPDPVDDRPINRSTLQVASDPGLWFKYIGSLTVVLGIITMFYMKAYFFKPRGQRAVAANLEPAVS